MRWWYKDPAELEFYFLRVKPHAASENYLNTGKNSKNHLGARDENHYQVRAGK